jgi:hypothetical protein
VRHGLVSTALAVDVLVIGLVVMLVIGRCRHLAVALSSTRPGVSPSRSANRRTADRTRHGTTALGIRG